MSTIIAPLIFGSRMDKADEFGETRGGGRRLLQLELGSPRQISGTWFAEVLRDRVTGGEDHLRLRINLFRPGCPASALPAGEAARLVDDDGARFVVQPAAVIYDDDTPRAAMIEVMGERRATGQQERGR